MPSRARMLPAAAALLAASGCVSVRPPGPDLELPGSRYLTVAGRRVHAVTAGAGEAVLLIHGFGASAHSWRKVMPELAREYLVIAPDLYGFGLTERPADLDLYSRDGQVDLLVALLDTLEVERIHAVGHSYGGGLALSLAYYHPERVRSLVLVDGTAPDYADRRRHPLAALAPWRWLYVRGLALRRRFVRRSLERSFEDDGLVTPELVDAYRDRLRIRGVTTAYRGLTAPRRQADSRPPVEVAEIDRPALSIWGERDVLITPELGRRGAAKLPGARFELIRDCGHIPMEEKPQEFLRLLLDFLSDVSAATPAPPRR